MPSTATEATPDTDTSATIAVSCTGSATIGCAAAARRAGGIGACGADSNARAPRRTRLSRRYDGHHDDRRGGGQRGESPYRLLLECDRDDRGDPGPDGERQTAGAPAQGPRVTRSRQAVGEDAGARPEDCQGDREREVDVHVYSLVDDLSARHPGTALVRPV